ncbi:protein trichome birefringence-like 11 isoform X1 [Physcomitrium patens]|uniref:Uncharacterized protein n=1 Tax=Physcomitrium patens TaxID=3218 RepID=A0A2K1KDS1_PHYPA|nr:protein trichome birefringence-like 11 isoform X1 [Physcomitrium patens]XP_024377430.1 protein trichome birefringence-like 11 isoform X1 [Physcomitrium patens]XP_024377431.1 protein trichome birefringence-like 11 isoform X1 [Physcomitrium patens]XP_024377432.1 protein trichome birefringence-like 11 isoform X1 [Physcomitrium patens]XP_024377433.1 protein trichome birefringence-like 11 isoform X1 [Physcomitrium patens]XP_024377434.1 protein trichome birefringence-like 11 isoform X1 [Physcomit|eukprot:XP_024377429.1 protein trichome birefringence-like 11 isoform X1 [Physcomitrella patens]
MALKQTLKKQESRGCGSGNLWRRINNSYAFRISVLAACGVGVLLLCFTYVDLKPFCDKIGKEPVVFQKDPGIDTLATYGLEEDSSLRAATPPEMNVDSGDGGAPEVEADGSSEKVRKTAKAFAVKENGTESSVIVGEAHVSGLDNDWVKSDARVSEDKDSRNEALAGPGVTETRGRDRRALAGCDIAHGKWVYDETYPLYRSRNCPFVDPGFRCEENGRPDTDYMKYRWQPNDCDLPSFDSQDMLEKLRDQRLVFVGDSLGRNQWESMLCMLAEGVQNKSRIYEINGHPISKHVGELVFRFQDYNCTVEYYRDPFLVPQTRPPPNAPDNVTNVLHIDQVSWTANMWPGASILVFNSGHWWSWEKIGRQGGAFQIGSNVTSHGFEEAFKIALETWALWIESNLDPMKTQVFFRSFASVHFRGGSWNTGGQCHEEVKPLSDEEVQKMQPVPWTNKYIEQTIKENIKTKKGVVEFMDVTTSTDYRSDGHSGLYANDVLVMGPTPMNRQDCSHFCLPGVPDTWNELLYATLLARGQGVWGAPER